MSDTLNTPFDRRRFLHATAALTASSALAGPALGQAGKAPAVVRLPTKLQLKFATIVADEYRRRYGKTVAVYVEALVAFNGRRAQPLVNPAVDLTRVPTGLAPKQWLMPLPSDPPEM